MSARNRSDARRDLLASAADLCSRQWTALGGLPRPLHERACSSIVDPEALILLSFVAREADARLEERLSWWARVGARHTSVQRTRNLVRSFPEDVEQAWKSFAVMAGRHGGASWRVHGDDSTGPMLRERTRAELHEPALVEPSTLLLRLRIGFGVNAKADLLAFLIGSPSHRFPASAMAHELAYFETTIQRAAGSMARAGLIREMPGHPVSYSIDHVTWARLLELDEESGSGPPQWRSWALLFPIVARAIEWLSLDASSSSYVRASRARDLYEASRGDLERWGLGLSKPERHQGDAFDGAFLEMLPGLAAWMQKVA